MRCWSFHCKLPPPVYLSAITASDRTRRLGWRQWLHFAPYAVAMLAMLPVLLTSGVETIEFYRNLQRGGSTFQIGLGSAAIWALAISFEIGGLLRLPNLAGADDVVSLAIAILVYATGYMALRQPEIFDLRRSESEPPNIQFKARQLCSTSNAVFRQHTGAYSFFLSEVGCAEFFLTSSAAVRWDFHRPN